MTLMVDVAYAWRDWKEALRAIEMFADEDIYFVETPLPSDDVEGYAKLCHASPVKIALGEWQNTRFEFLEFMNAKAVDVVQPDVGRVGGLTEAKRVAMHARDRGLAVVPHCWKSAIGIAASAHLAAVAPTCTFIEFLPRELADSALRRDLCSAELPVVDGRIPLPTGPGLGVTLNEEAIGRIFALDGVPDEDRSRRLFLPLHAGGDRCRRWQPGCAAGARCRRRRGRLGRMRGLAAHLDCRLRLSHVAWRLQAGARRGAGQSL